MKKSFFLLGLLPLVSFVVPVVSAAGTDIFLYEFNAADPLIDSISGDNKLTLKEPATVGEEVGLSGGGLQIQPPISATENANFAQLPRSVIKSFPTDAVKLEFDYRPDGSVLTGDKKMVYLIDQMYSEKEGLQVLYLPPQQALQIRVGNGEKILTATSPSLSWNADEWRHLTLVYDASTGTLRVQDNDSEVATAADPSFGPLQYGAHPLRVGNRLGSHYGNAPGTFDNLRMTQPSHP